MDIVLIDETFDLNQTKNYHISIQVGLNGYSFSVLDPLRNKYILLKHFPFPKEMTHSLLEEKVNEITGTDEFLTRDYKTVLFSYQTPKYTLIPGPLFNKKKLRSCFEFNHYLDDLDEIHYNSLKGTDAYNVFVIPTELSSIVYKAFRNVIFYHQATPLIEHSLISHGGKSSQKVAIANIYGKNADIVVVSGDNLLLCNTFPWKNEDDLVYFILYVYEQLKLNGEETPLYISGEMPKTSPAYDLLKSYIKKTIFEKRNDHFVYSYTFNDVDAHWFVNLFNLRLCV
ncbi:MAG: DUF3822 family protein [Bacteroidales bacterium]